MVRSLYSGVSGLKNHQVRMDVIGNNISNVNTNGFKKGRVTFQDMLSQTLSGAAKPNSDKGGVNPKQVGLGMTVASIDTIHTNGSVQVTGKKTDMAIMGSGFFINKKGSQTFYSRAGNFSIDKNGTLVNPANGFKIQGWESTKTASGEYIINTSSSTGDLKIPIGAKDPASATKNVTFKCNLSALTPIVQPNAKLDEAFVFKNTHKAQQLVYDSYGKEHKLNVKWTRQGINLWRAQMSVDDGSQVTVDAPGQGNNNTNIVYFAFNRNGSIASVTDAQPNKAPTANVSGASLFSNLSFNLADGSRSTIKLNFGTAGLVDGVTQFDSKSTTKAVSQDGYGMGYLQSFNIDGSGEITGIFSNGQKRAVGQLALATFTNPGGLEKIGSNNYAVSNNSGSARVAAAGDEDKGTIRAGALEMSNVDLSEEFTNMIVTQRGFQANSRVITTSDQMLQELLTLKR